MFECKFHSGQIFKEIVDVISSIIEEGELTAKPDGLDLICMNESKVALIDVLVSKNLCETYECDKDTPLKINFTDFYKFVSRVSGNEDIFLRFIEETNKLQIKIKGKSTRTFSLPLLTDVKSENVERKDIGYEVKFEMDTNVILQAIKDAKAIDNTMSFIVNKEGLFYFEVKGDTGDLRIDFEEKPVEKMVDDQIYSIYSLDILTKIFRANILSDTVTLAFGNETPLILNFPIKNDVNNGRIVYFIAPQVMEDEYDEDEYDEGFEDTDIDEDYED